MGYITLIPQLPGIYGNINRPCPRAVSSDSGRFTAINPRQLGYNYYMHTVYDVYYVENFARRKFSPISPSALIIMLILLSCIKDSMTKFYPAKNFMYTVPALLYMHSDIMVLKPWFLFSPVQP